MHISRMEWNEFQQLQPGDRVSTTKWGDAYVKKWRNERKLEVQLYKFSKPNRHCAWYARTEIKEKL